MANAVISQETTIDPDIELILDEARVKATREYRLGFVDGQKQIIGDAMAAIKDQMRGPAESFYRSLAQIIPEKDILQHRIGKDYTTGAPTTLTVISRKRANKMADILYAASSLELYMFNVHGYDCSFWVITDEGLEEALVERDFPFFRVGG